MVDAHLVSSSSARHYFPFYSFFLLFVGSGIQHPFKTDRKHFPDYSHTHSLIAASIKHAWAGCGHSSRLLTYERLTRTLSCTNLRESLAALCCSPSASGQMTLSHTSTQLQSHVYNSWPALAHKLSDTVLFPRRSWRSGTLCLNELLSTYLLLRLHTQKAFVTLKRVHPARKPGSVFCETDSVSPTGRFKVDQFNIVLLMIEMGEINKNTNIPPISGFSFFIREILQESSPTRLITSLISSTAHFSMFRWNFLFAVEFIDRLENHFTWEKAGKDASRKRLKAKQFFLNICLNSQYILMFQLFWSTYITSYD